MTLSFQQLEISEIFSQISQISYRHFLPESPTEISCLSLLPKYPTGILFFSQTYSEIQPNLPNLPAISLKYPTGILYIFDCHPNILPKYPTKLFQFVVLKSAFFIS